eukprot:scaffold1973_cov156-Skeletonema_menzelii.AAC.10
MAWAVECCHSLCKSPAGVAQSSKMEDNKSGENIKTRRTSVEWRQPSQIIASSGQLFECSKADTNTVCLSH